MSGKNKTTFDEMIRLDIDYAEQLSLGLDLAILAKTPLTLWEQYRELRAARRPQRVSGARRLNKPVELIRL